jgi:Na+/H+ antiporter NhaD/arsenite permease-like protein
MLAAAWGSWRTGRSLRTADKPFRWGPILEVAALFSGIFLAMVPALRWVANMAPTMPLNDVSLFLLTGGLSSVLDNAPTYAVFFELAKGLHGANPVAGVGAKHLAAVSLGAVLCGANTYIGNGPNFMVKAIAEAGGVRMPSFAGYIVRWVIPFFLPVLAAMLLVFITDDWRFKAAGAALTLVLLVVHGLRITRNPDPHRKPAAAQRA